MNEKSRPVAPPGCRFRGVSEVSRILIVSDRLWPSVGGVQTVTRLLGRAMAAQGRQVCVVTNEPGPAERFPGVWVHRLPGPIRLLRLYQWAEAIILQGLPTRLGWPLLLRRRGVALAVHHNAPPAHNAFGACGSLLARRTRHAAVSRALARELPWPVEEVLPNPYDESLFRCSGIPRDRDIIFVGRLIPEKGVQVLIEALGLLRRAGYSISATIVGDGEERGALEKLAKKSRLEKCLLFTGTTTGAGLAELLNRHHVMVVPSTYQEPFGIVALEGIACGCIAIGSEAGGLPEAIGPCGTIVPPRNPEALAAEISDALARRLPWREYRRRAKTHLAAHQPGAVASRYLELLRRLSGSSVSARGTRKAERRSRPETLRPVKI